MNYLDLLHFTLQQNIDKAKYSNVLDRARWVDCESASWLLIS